MPPDNLTIESARQLVEAALAISAAVNARLVDLQVKVPADEFKWCRRALAGVLMAILTDVLNPVFLKYPSLKPEGFE
jgi:hypothetical protein